ncbi:nucleotide-diphosphate-sugar epimerase [Nocardia sputorum]|uniref:SDR family oxidoreductase n=1 Tax=Nocardia sputorum TaxID=2984338 RepID=UPI002492926F|nr:NAD(P)H-binding protein [Nocardia sputorum]BDT92356.1 nucleotide-diphosphate-sugar epimerase [Nocardia sputorum]
MTYLVTGVRGIVGRAVVDQLREAGKPVRAASSQPAETTVPDGVDLVGLDLTDPGSVTAALTGVDKIFCYAAAEGIDNFVDAAKAAGVAHIVLLSSIAAENDHNPIGARHLAVENPLRASGLPLTVLRPGAFAANARFWFSTIKADRVVRVPFPDLQLTPIHEADIAAAAVTALDDPSHAGKIYPLTGPESLSHRQQVAAIAAALGERINLIELSYEEAADIYYRPVLDLWAKAGTEPSPVGPTSESITGTPARTFAQWAVDHVDDYR